MHNAFNNLQKNTMGILVINSSTNFSSVSIGDNFEVLGSRLSLNQKGHSEVLPPMIESLLAEHPNQIEAVAVVIGPSSYTALRLGITAAKMLSIAWSIPIISIRTSFIYSYFISNFVSESTPPLPSCVILDTRRQKFWLECYSKDNPFSMNSQAKLYDREELLLLLSRTEFTITGDCLDSIQEDCDLDTRVHERSSIIEPPCLEKMVELQHHVAFSLWTNRTKHNHILSQSKGDRLTPIYFGDVK